MMVPWREGNRLTLLERGRDFFPALSSAIEAAQREVLLESYIFAHDRIGASVLDSLRRAAARGLRVRLLLDGFGARDFPKDWRRDCEDAGVQLLFYRPEVFRWPPARTRLRRLHRKLAVVDSNLAFVGGINIVDDDADFPGESAPRLDYALRVEGPVVDDVHATMTRLWHVTALTQLRIRWATRPAPPPPVWPAGPIRAALLRRDNLRHRQDIENTYLAALASARQEIIIANAYFLPGRRFRQALVDAAARGVRVVLLLQGRVEYLLLELASRAMYDTLLAAGVEIHLYQAGFLHAKVAVIDGRWITVGSSNIDPFSLLLAREANLVAEDAAFAHKLRHSLEQAIDSRSRQLQVRAWRRNALWRWPLYHGAWVLARLLTRLAAYREDY